MTSEGSGEWFPLPDEDTILPATSENLSERLDSLLPDDPATGVATYAAFRVYLGGFMDLMARHGQPLSLLAIAADPSETLRRLGPNGALLIASAIARCLRQETRIYDVVGRGQAEDAYGANAFLVALPMTSETLARPFAARLREAMTISTGNIGSPWLTVSVGIASLSLETDSPEKLILRSQQALAGAQRSGGDCIWGHADTVRRIIEGEWHDSSQE